MQDRRFPPCLDQPGSSATNYKPPRVCNWCWRLAVGAGQSKEVHPTESEFNNKQCLGSLIQTLYPSTLCPTTSAALSTHTGSKLPCNWVIHTRERWLKNHPALPPDSEMAADDRPERSANRNMRHATALTFILFFCLSSMFLCIGSYSDCVQSFLKMLF